MRLFTVRPENFFARLNNDVNGYLLDLDAFKSSCGAFKTSRDDARYVTRFESNLFCPRTTQSLRARFRVAHSRRAKNFSSAM
jgi:hypothetical protein